MKRTITLNESGILTKAGRTLLLAILSFALFTPSIATVLTVTNTNDSGAGSLRDVIGLANSGDTIMFDASLIGSTITLTSGNIAFAKTLTIIGPGYDQLSISGNSSSRIFDISGGDIVITGLKLRNAHVTAAPWGEHGGAIRHENGGTLVLRSVYFFEDTTYIDNGVQGGAIYYGVNNGFFSADSCYFVHCASNDFGGAISCNGGPDSVRINACTFDGNRALAGSGGVLFTNTLSAIIRNSTFCNNTSAGNNAIANITSPAVATFINCTFSNNNADNTYYGISGMECTLNMINCTYADNNEPVGIISFMQPANFSVQNCIFDNPGGNFAHNGNVNTTSLGGNVSSDNSMSGFLTAANDTNSIDPMLAPLANNGGITSTYALLPGSIAINNGISLGAPVTDQIGHGRLGNIDSGALEYCTSANTITVIGCHTYTSPGGDHIWTSSGIYYDTIPNAMGCDSTLTIHLTIIDTVNVGVYQLGTSLISLAPFATWQWIDCNNGNLPIAGATAQSYTATANGSYAVIVHENACTDTSACYTVSGIGISEYSLNDRLSIYPNPTDGNILVDLGEKLPDMIVSITNVLGEVLSIGHYSNTSLLNLQIDGENGVYFLTVTSGDKTAVARIVKL